MRLNVALLTSVKPIESTACGGAMGNNIEIHFDGVEEMVAAIRDRADKAHAAAKAAADAMATTFIRSAKQYATGPARGAGRERRTRKKNGQPSRTLSWRQGGPGVVSGFLRNSIQVRQSSAYGIAGWQDTVHPSGPYYRRLELGFVGRDSIGRRYNQPPYPYMRPARDDTITQGRARAVSAFKKVLSA
jgi:hypothetical protein